MEEKKENSLDLTVIIPLLLGKWKKYALCCLGSVVFSLIFVFTIPRYYECKVMLAPEATDKDGLSSLMSSFGFGEQNKTDDAISPNLYPDLIGSTDFVVSMFPVEVATLDGSVKTDYYDYVLKYNQNSWYMSIVGAVADLFKSKDEMEGEAAAGTSGMKYSPSFLLSDEQHDVAGAITDKIQCDYDKKTGVISVTVKDFDPLVCAMVADTVSNKLQNFILDYRTKKARKDLEYTRRIYEQAQAEYEESNDRYVAAVDANWDIVNETVKAQLEKLSNDKTLKYQVFSSVSQKLEAAKAKVQEATPVITVLQGSSVPEKPAGPKRVLITLALMFVSCLGYTIYVIAKNKAI